MAQPPSELRGFLETYRFGGWNGDAQNPSSGSREPILSHLSEATSSSEAARTSSPTPVVASSASPPDSSPKSPVVNLPPAPHASGSPSADKALALDEVAPSLRRASLPLGPALELDPGPPYTPLNVSASSIPLTADPPPSLPRTASELWDFYQTNRYLPAPVPPRQALSLRVRTVTRLNLLAPSRRAAVRRICRLAKAYFDEPDDTLIITILDGAKQIVLSEEGNALQGIGVRLAGERGADPEDLGPRVMDINLGFCPHGIVNAATIDPQTGRLIKGNQTFIVRDANRDWRFAGNPFVTQNGGRLHFYAGSSIYAKRNAADSDAGSTASSVSDKQTPAASEGDDAYPKSDVVPVGSFCLIAPRARKFSPKDQAVLEEFAGLISREFELAFEAERREKESRMRDWISSFIGESVLPTKAQLEPAPNPTTSPVATAPSASEAGPSTSATPASAEATPRPGAAGQSTPATSTGSIPEHGFRERLTSRRRSSDTAGSHQRDGKGLFVEAAQQTRRLLGADSAAIADLRSLRPYLHNDGHNSKYYVNPARTGGIPSTHVHGDGADLSPSSRRASWIPTLHDANGTPTPANAIPAPTHPSPHALTILGESHCEDWVASLAATGESAPVFLEQTVVDFLNEYARTGQVIFHCDDATPAPTPPLNPVNASEGAPSGLTGLTEEVDPLATALGGHGMIRVASTSSMTSSRKRKLGPLWPLMPQDTTAYAAVPFSDHDGEPCLLLLVTSRQPYFRFEDGDRTFLASVGAVCISALMKQRVVEADAAKLSFVSRVSHELRTPLWAVLSQLEMIRMTLPPDALARIDSLLQVAEACGDTLGTLLEDVLAHGKLSQESSEPPPKQPLRRADLEALLIEVAIVSWKRRQRMDIVEMYAVESQSSGTDGAQGGVQGDGRPPLRIFVEIDERTEGWDAMVDVAGLKRILLNLVGNSLKFTKEGRVVISIRELPSPGNLTSTGDVDHDPTVPPSRIRWVEFCVLDTGCGMEEDWIKNDLFTAFKQKNPFAVGAGLGMSICHSLVRRMSGKIQVASRVNVGTTIRVTLPVELSVLPPEPPRLPRSIRRIDASEPTTSLPPPKTKAVEAGMNKLSIRPADGGIAVAASTPQNAAEPIADSPARLGATVERSSRETSPAASAVFSASSNVTTPLTSPQPAPEPRREFKVLVIDDNPVSRTVMTALLKKKDVPFISAANGFEGVERYKQQLPALIWLDHEMPGLTGTEAAELIRVHEEANNLPRCRIVILSGLSGEQNVRNGFKSGVDDWLVKGNVSLKMLAERVDELRNSPPFA